MLSSKNEIDAVRRLFKNDSKGLKAKREIKLKELSPRFCAFGYRTAVDTPSARQGLHLQSLYGGMVTIRRASGIHVMRTG